MSVVSSYSRGYLSAALRQTACLPVLAVLASAPALAAMPTPAELDVPADALTAAGKGLEMFSSPSPLSTIFIGTPVRNYTIGLGSLKTYLSGVKNHEGRAGSRRSTACNRRLYFPDPDIQRSQGQQNHGRGNGFQERQRMACGRIRI